MADATGVVANDFTYQYIKLLLENAWIPAAALVVLWLLTRPQFLRRITSIEFGSFKLQLQALEQQLEATQAQVDHLASRNAELAQVVSEFDADDNLSNLQGTRARLRQIGRTIIDDEMAQVLDGLKPDASPEQLFSAAIILRTRRDPRNFDALVQCLDRLAADKTLRGIRLNTVWQLTSALHLTLVSDLQNASKPTLRPEQLEAAKAMLQRLIANPRVQNDRPDVPSKGIRGPAGYALNWIERGLKGAT